MIRCDYNNLNYSYNFGDIIIDGYEVGEIL